MRYTHLPSANVNPDINSTERGVSATLAQRDEINALITSLEAGWQGEDALKGSNRDYLLRECEVAYVGQTSSKKANAAGGKFVSIHTFIRSYVRKCLKLRAERTHTRAL